MTVAPSYGGAMYSTCLHCNAALGANEVVAAFPVGRRLAFDAARGRLWVVCPSCGRWNLTPLEERWEAIEECERLYRVTPLRSATDNIGLARVRGGLDLIRVGKPARPELAAWRYGAALRQRWRENRFVPFLADATNLSTISMATTLFYLGSGSMLASLASSGMTFGTVWITKRITSRDVRARVVLPDGRVTNARALNGVQLILDPTHDGGWALRSVRGSGADVAAEQDAARTLRGVLAYRNVLTGRPDTIAKAVDRLGRQDDARTFINRLSRAAQRTGLIDLRYYPAEALLALEMALHDEAERRAMEGELQALAVEWALAEEVARIADDLFIPAAVLGRLKALGAAWPTGTP